MADKTNQGEFSAAEKAAMRERARELKAEAKRGQQREEGEKDLLAKIAEMKAPDKRMAKKIHEIVTKTAPHLMPKTWYGMPAYANEDGKVVVFFKDAGKFESRYATLGFEEASDLDAGAMWPTSYALVEVTEAEEKKITALVKKAAGRRRG